MEQYLKFNSVEIDQCNKERKEIRAKNNEILNQIQTLNQDKQQIERGREFIQDRFNKLESELDEFET
jgi:chromosome segregation ATPase